MYRVTCIRNYHQITDLHDEWQRLQSICADSWPFNSWEWCVTWFRYFGEDRKPFVLLVRKAGKMIGLWPLMMSTQDIGIGIKLRRLQFVGYRKDFRWNDCMDILAVEDEKANVIEQGLRFLHGYRYHWDQLDLWDIPETSMTIEVLKETARRYSWYLEVAENAVCPYVTTNKVDWEEYQKSRVKSARGDIGRQKKRLQKIGDLKVIYFYGEDIQKRLPFLFNMHKNRWAHTNTPSIFERDAQHKDFYRAIGSIFFPEHLTLMELQLNGEPIASHFGFVWKRRLCYMTPVFDWNYCNYSPGKILNYEIIKYGFENDHIDIIDFQRGAEAYKYDWATSKLHVYHIVLWSPVRRIRSLLRLRTYPEVIKARMRRIFRL